MVNSIKKGKAFEREAVKILDDITGAIWKRVPMSGAFATVNKSNDPRFCGDVFTEDERYSKVVIECKVTKSFEINDLFSMNGKLASWINQCETESREMPWILIFKINRKGVYIIDAENILPEDGFNREMILSIVAFEYPIFKFK